MSTTISDTKADKSFRVNFYTTRIIKKCKVN